MPNLFPLPHLISRHFVNKTSVKCSTIYLDRKSDVNKNERDLYSVDQEAFEEHLEKSEAIESTRNQLLAWTNHLPRLKRFHSVIFVLITVWIVIAMSLHWTLIAGFLYAEIAVVLILLIPFISNKTWRKLFKSRFLKGIENQFIYYFYILVAILVLFFLGE